MAKNRLVLKEEPDDLIIADELPLELDIPVEIPDIIPEEPIIEPAPIEEVPEEVAVNVYSDLLQNLLKKQWDVINEADSIIATLNSEESDINKEDLLAILNKLTEETTVSIGMVTKALGVVDPSQEELMNQGVEKAEEVISGQLSTEEDKKIPEVETDVFVEPEEESLREEGVSENFEDLQKLNYEKEAYYNRYWFEEVYAQLEFMLEDYENHPDYYEDDDEMITLGVLDSEGLDEVIWMIFIVF